MPRQDLALFDGEGQYDVGAVLQPPSKFREEFLKQCDTLRDTQARQRQQGLDPRSAMVAP
jgi:hypothetical protein